MGSRPHWPPPARRIACPMQTTSLGARCGDRGWGPRASPRARPPLASPHRRQRPERCGCPSLRLDEALADGVARELDAVVHAQLLQDVGAVAVDRLLADDQRVRDLAGAVAL